MFTNKYNQCSPLPQQCGSPAKTVAHPYLEQCYFTYSYCRWKHLTCQFSRIFKPSKKFLYLAIELLILSELGWELFNSFFRVRVYVHVLIYSGIHFQQIRHSSKGFIHQCIVQNFLNLWSISCMEFERKIVKKTSLYY